MINKILRKKLKKLQKEWHIVRDERLNLKENIPNRGTGEYRKHIKRMKILKKEQGKISTGIKHLVKKINKAESSKHE